MTEYRPNRQLPTIPSEPSVPGNVQQDPATHPAQQQPPPQAQPQNHGQWLDGLKFGFGKLLIGWSLAAVVGLCIVQFVWGSPDRDGTLTPAIELLKLVTTTALGFVFAKSQDLGNALAKERKDTHYPS